MKILAVSDVEVSFLYSPVITQRFPHIDLMISCGDLPYFYLEYMVSLLNRPMYYVNGNHMNQVESGERVDRHAPQGARLLHRRTLVGPDGVLLAGMDGSVQYNFGPSQYSQGEMWRMVLLLAPKLIANKGRYGRYLDIFVSHAPPRHVQDMEDLPHQGFEAFRWLLSVFRPAYHLHGHIHLYRQDAPFKTQFDQTSVINVYGYREIDWQPPGPLEVNDERK